jgi:hypothetical protein
VLAIDDAVPAKILKMTEASVATFSPLGLEVWEVATRTRRTERTLEKCLARNSLITRSSPAEKIVSLCGKAAQFDRWGDPNRDLLR